MRTPSFDADRAVALATVLTSLVVAVTCASARPGPSGRLGSDPSSPPAVPSTPSAPSATEAHDVSADPAPEPAPAAQQERLALSRFFAALRDKKEGTHVRVLWLGDSHTAADFLPHALREPLQNRFGNGGPGFVAVGVDKYRHGRLTVKSDGRWRREPSNPASSSRHADGVFGLSGVRVVPVSPDAKTKLELSAGAVAGGAHWELMYRAKAGERFALRIDGGADKRADAASGEAGPNGSPVRRVRIKTAPRASVTLAAAAGSPEAFGVIVESVSGGVVVDTLGINGARAATALAWDEPSFVAEVRARAPSLAVVAYGTNEAAGSVSAEKYASDLVNVIGRLRRAVPELDCVLFGPTDMADASGQSKPRVAELDRAAERAAGEAKCGYFSLYQAMGGQGAMARWVRESPPLAAPDRIHLTAKGYERIGALFATELIEAYDRFAAAP